MPLWAYGKRVTGDKIYSSMQQIEQIFKKYPGGIATSEINSTQQWDFPNAWPPITSLLIDALADFNKQDT
jgi:alpha,alpha-trehalase